MEASNCFQFFVKLCKALHIIYKIFPKSAWTTKYGIFLLVYNDLNWFSKEWGNLFEITIHKYILFLFYELG